MALEPWQKARLIETAGMLHKTQPEVAAEMIRAASEDRMPWAGQMPLAGGAIPAEAKAAMEALLDMVDEALQAGMAGCVRPGAGVPALAKLRHGQEAVRLLRRGIGIASEKPTMA